MGHIRIGWDDDDGGLGNNIFLIKCDGERGTELLQNNTIPMNLSKRIVIANRQ